MGRDNTLSEEAKPKPCFDEQNSYGMALLNGDVQNIFPNNEKRANHGRRQI